mmetsp:Transcript_44338/g.96536  ORF Transcript_44338/g.96536 Transcript_44338/m.96536 type:complete len:277 (-) Transcript_44338:224-1054(-)
MHGLCPLCIRASCEECPVTDLNRLFVVHRKLAIPPSSPKILIDSSTQHLAQQRCGSCGSSVGFLHSAVQQIELLVPDLHGLRRSFVGGATSIIQADPIKGPFASPQKATQTVGGTLHRKQQLLQVMQNVADGGVPKLSAGCGNFSANMGLSLIEQNMLRSDCSLLPGWHAQGPEGAHQPLTVYSEMSHVWTHAHVDLVLDPNILRKCAKALDEALGHWEDAGGTKKGHLHIYLRLLSVGQLVEKPRVEKQVRNVRQLLLVQPITQVLHIIEGQNHL